MKISATSNSLDEAERLLASKRELTQAFVYLAKKGSIITWDKYRIHFIKDGYKLIQFGVVK